MLWKTKERSALPLNLERPQRTHALVRAQSLAGGPHSTPWYVIRMNVIMTSADLPPTAFAPLQCCCKFFSSVAEIDDSKLVAGPQCQNITCREDFVCPGHGEQDEAEQLVQHPCNLIKFNSGGVFSIHNLATPGFDAIPDVITSRP